MSERSSLVGSNLDSRDADCATSALRDKVDSVLRPLGVQVGNNDVGTMGCGEDGSRLSDSVTRAGDDDCFALQHLTGCERNEEGIIKLDFEQGKLIKRLYARPTPAPKTEPMFVRCLLN